MAKLYFYYSAMNAGKSTTLLQSSYNYQERGMNTLILAPDIDNREDQATVTSRIGLSANATTFHLSDNLYQVVEELHQQQRLDCVLVDAPCSGLGTIRRDPDIRWRRTSVDLARYADTQRALLTQAAKTVRPGGRLVYATCSSEPEENEEVVEAFLANHPSYDRIHPEHMGMVSPGLRAVLNADGYLATSPEAHALESFFGVTLLRQARGAPLAP